MKESKFRKLLVPGAIVLFAALIAFLVWLSLRPPTVRIEIFVTPSDSEVTMDGKPIRAGVVDITVGKHTLVAERQYFEAATLEVDTNHLLTDAKAVYLSLYPNSPEGEAYFNTHPDELTRYERADGAEHSTEVAKILDQYPLTTDLPYQTTSFKINYDIKDDGTIVYLVNLYPVATKPGTDLYKKQLEGFKAEVLDWLKDKGVDVSKSTISFSPDPNKL